MSYLIKLPSMKKDLRSSSTIWSILLLHFALFILLVVIRNIQFWQIRSVSTNLVEFVSKSTLRQSNFTNLENSVINEQISVLKLLSNPAENKNQEIIGIINSEVAKNDSNLVASYKFISTQKEKEIFERLKIVSKEKEERLIAFFQLFEQAKYGEANKNYEEYLLPIYSEFKLGNSSLLKTISTRDKTKIKVLEGTINTSNNINSGLSVTLIILLIFLIINLAKVGKINKKTRLELKESEYKYRTLSEQTNEIIERCDANGKFVFANDSFKKRLEYDDEDLSKLFFSDILAEGAFDLNELLKKDEGMVTNVQRVFKSKSGKKIYLEGNIVLEYSDGDFVGSMGFFNDVTEKKHLEESLISSELKFRSFFDVAPIPMGAFDPETLKFVLINKAAVNQYGFSEEEFLNKTILEIRRDDDISKIKDDIRKMKEDVINSNKNKIYKSSLNHFKKSGEKVEVEIYTALVLIDGKDCILTVAIDVTERNQNEYKMTKAIIKTQEDERYEIGGELHDNVCQILAATKMSLSRVRPSLSGTAIDLYNQSSEGIMLAIEEIRNLSHRLAPAFFDNTKLEEAFEGLFKTFNVTNTYNISLDFDSRAKNLNISQEIQLSLYRILQEQLRNIITHAKCTSIEVEVFIKNDKLQMRIADDGIGFNMHQVKEGIGLSNMKRRAEIFSGKFHITSSQGKGCEILIAIPIAKTLHEAVPEKLKNSGLKASNTKMSL
ncbi:MAG: PAS domain S-box protein [Ginsengibacter sp.]